VARLSSNTLTAMLSEFLQGGEISIYVEILTIVDDGVWSSGSASHMLDAIRSAESATYGPSVKTNIAGIDVAYAQFLPSSQNAQRMVFITEVGL